MGYLDGRSQASACGRLRVEEQQPLLAPVPTYTMFARTSVFAGGYPNGGWRGIKSGGYTRNEGELAARNVGLNTPKEYEEDMIFLTQTDTAEEQG